MYVAVAKPGSFIVNTTGCCVDVRLTLRYTGKLDKSWTSIGSVVVKNECLLCCIMLSFTVRCMVYVYYGVN